MVDVLIKTDSHYRANRKRTRELVANYLAEKNVKGKVEVSIAIVGDRLMRKINSKYRNVDETTNVLSFPLMNIYSQAKFVEPPDDVLRLGDIVISYPQVLEDAAAEDKMVDDKIDELIIHGLDHLLG